MLQSSKMRKKLKFPKNVEVEASALTLKLTPMKYKGNIRNHILHV